jgi:hypothetical protein
MSYEAETWAIADISASGAAQQSGAADSHEILVLSQMSAATHFIVSNPRCAIACLGNHKTTLPVVLVFAPPLPLVLGQ